MTLHIDFSPQDEARLAAVARREGIDLSVLIKRLVKEYLPVLDEPASYMTPEEKIKAMDALAETNRGRPVLPDAAFDRENLYDERC